MRAQQREVDIVLEATGTVTALNSVDVRPQISSTITKVHIREGQFVKQGQLLFTLDARNDEVNVTKAKAQLAKDMASLADAQRQLARSRDLFAQNFISQGAVDTNQTLVEAQQAVVASDRAAIEAAQVGLSYTRIVAPSAGRAGAINVFAGSSVQPAGAVLVTITQLDPIAVGFNLPQRNLGDALQTLRGGGGKVSAVLPEGRGTLTGRLQFVDNAVDAGSGTVRVKAEFPNSDEKLWPGAFVNVRLAVQTLEGRGGAAAGRDHHRAARPDRLCRRCRQQGRRRDRSRSSIRSARRRSSAACAPASGSSSTAGRTCGPARPSSSGRRPRAAGARGVAAALRRRLRPRRAGDRRRAGQRPGGRRGAAGDVVGSHAMNLSELFIRRPVLTVLLNAAIVVAGVIAYNRIPIAALPSYNTPVINVSAQLPGASPETMATSVALQLEKQFSTIPGLNVISSTNTLGATSLTLEFDEGRDIDAASVDVQAALLRAQRQLPQDMTVPPSYRKVNPADAPVLLMAMTSPSLNLSDLNDFAEHLISPSLSTLDGVAQVNIFGQKRYAVRVRVNPEALSARNISLDELTNALRAANANTPVGTLEGPQQTLTLQANKQLRNAAEFADLIVSTRNGNPVRLRDVAQVEDSFETVKTAATFNGESSITLAVLRQPGANTVKVVDAVRAALPGFQSQLPQSVRINLVNDRSVSIRDALHDVTLTLFGTIVLVVLVIFLFLRRFVATVIPTLVAAGLAARRGVAAVGVRLHARQHLAARHHARGRPRRRRRDRDAREHHAPRRERRAAVPGRAARLARGRLHDHLDLELAGRGLHPDLLHARRDRPAVPRVRGRSSRSRSSRRRSSR